MTNKQAAEVLRRHKKGAEELLKTAPAPNGEVFLSELMSALETAIAVMEAAPPTYEQIGRLFNRHSDSTVDYFHGDEPAMTRTAFIQAARELLALNNGK